MALCRHYKTSGPGINRRFVRRLMNVRMNVWMDEEIHMWRSLQARKCAIATIYKYLNCILNFCLLLRIMELKLYIHNSPNLSTNGLHKHLNIMCINGRFSNGYNYENIVNPYTLLQRLFLLCRSWIEWCAMTKGHQKENLFDWQNISCNYFLIMTPSLMQNILKLLNICKKILLVLLTKTCIHIFRHEATTKRLLCQFVCIVQTSVSSVNACCS